MKSRSSRLTLTGSRACGPWPGAAQHHQLRPALLRQRDPARLAGDRVARALDHERGALHAPGQVAHRVGRDPVLDLHVDQRLRRRVEPPPHAVLDQLGRVRLVEHLREEELEEAAVVLEPVVAVVLLPALVVVALLVPRQVAAVDRLAERHRGADEDRALDPLGVLGGQQQRALGAERERHEVRALGAGRVHHRERVGDVVGRGVAALRAVGEPVAAAVEQQHAAVAREVRDLHLPVARVDDRPRREQQHGRLAGAVDLVVAADAVALDVARLVRLAGAHQERSAR